MSASGERRRNKDGGRNDWQTPPGLFNLLNEEFHFTIDGAASADPETGKPDGSNTTGSTVFVFRETSKPRLVYLWDWRSKL